MQLITCAVLEGTKHYPQMSLNTLQNVSFGKLSVLVTFIFLLCINITLIHV